MITIGLIGVDRGLGVTHSAISIASYLKRKKNKVIIIEKNSHKDFFYMGEELELLDEESQGDFFSYQGIDFCISDINLASLRKEGYDIVIFDFGEWNENSINSLCKIDYPILICGARKWNRNRPSFYSVLEEVEENLGIDGVYFAFPFATSEDKKEIKKAIPQGLYPPVEETPFDGMFSVPFIEEEITKETPTLLKSLSDISEGFSKKRTEEMKKEYDAKLQNLQKEKEDELRRIEEEKQKLEEEKRLAYLHSITDSLTGAKNRKGFDEDFAKKDKMTLVMLDVNFLKKINDTKGHEAGDLLIQTCCNTLSELFKDNVYRLGGDEFVVITDLSYSNVEEKCKQLDLLLEEKSNDDMTFEMAWGIVSTDTCAKDDLLKEADVLMYQDKQEKKKKYASDDYVDDRLFDTSVQDKLDEEIKEKERMLEEKQAEFEQRQKEMEEELVRLEQAEKEQKEKEEALKEKLNEKKEEWEDRIPYTSLEEDVFPETAEKKSLSAMWYAKNSVHFNDALGYHEIEVYSFPIEYKKAPFSSKSIICVIENDNIQLFLDGNHSFKVGVTSFIEVLRFNQEGKLDVSLICDSERSEVIENEFVIHNGELTPTKFTKSFFEYELLPIKKNINGVYDCILIDGSLNDESLSSHQDGVNLSYSKGIEKKDGHTYSFQIVNNEFVIQEE